MQPQRGSRALAVVLALAFALTGIREWPTAGCPHHRPAMLPGLPAGPGHQHHASQAPSPGDGGHHPAPCTCVGACQAGCGLAPAPSARGDARWTPTAIRQVALGPDGVLPPPRRAFFHPYAHGPPSD